MGKGKGSFDHWASRIAVSKVIFEIKGDIHEQVARDAFRLAGNKMPGTLRPSPLYRIELELTSVRRHVRVRQEGRRPSSRHHEAGRYYNG